MKKSNLSWLVIKSGFKNSFKNPLQLIGLSFLIAISLIACLFMNVAYQRIEKNYHNLSTQSNLRDFIVDSQKSPKISFNENDIIGGETILNYSNQDLYQQYLLNVISNKGKKFEEGEIKGKNFFDWSRTESRLFTNIKNGVTELNIKGVTKTSIVKVNEQKELEEHINVDKLVVYSGQNFSNDKSLALHQIIIQDTFAKKNNIFLGDIIRLVPDQYGNQLLVKKDVHDLPFGIGKDINDPINGIEKSVYKSIMWFQVIGTGSSIDFVYPSINNTKSLPNNSKEMIAYLSPEVFGLTLESISEEYYLYSYNFSKAKLVANSESEREIYFSGSFIDREKNTIEQISAFNNQWVKSGNISTDNLKLFYSNKDPSYKFFSRVTILNNVLYIYKVLSTVTTVIISLVCLFVTVLLIKKQLADTKSKMGTFKALGCSNMNLINFFLITPIIVALGGFIIAYLMMVGLQEVFVNAFSSYFNISYGKFTYCAEYAPVILLGAIVILVLISFYNAFLVLNNKAIVLLVGDSSQKLSWLDRFYKGFYKKSSKSAKLHAALMISSKVKVLGSTLILLISTILISFSVMLPTIVSNNKKESFKGLNYQDIVEYTNPIANNPSTFLKTYNPNKKDDWSYLNGKNIVEDFSESNKKKQKYITSYPLIDIEGKPTYDFNKILKDLIVGDVSRNYYSYNIPIVESNPDSELVLNELSKNNYANWKNLSIRYLELLDNISIPDSNNFPGPYKAIASILNQWSDYSELVNIVYEKSNEVKDTIDPKYKKLAGIALSQKLINFYKKSINALPLKVNSNFIKDGALSAELLEKIDYNTQILTIDDFDVINKEVKTPFKFASTEDVGLLIDNANTKWTKLLKDFLNDFSSKTSELSFQGKPISNTDFENLNIDELQEINTYLVLWYWIHFEGKIGTSFIQSIYQKETSQVQDNMKKALLKNEDYNITYNVVPFDKENDELGTMLHGVFEVGNSKNNINILGLEPSTKAVSLIDSQNRDIKENLFKNLNDNYKEYIPIIVNQTFAKKLSVNVKDNLEITINQKLITNNSNEPISLEAVKMGIQNKNGDNQYLTEYNKNYYAYNETDTGWSTNESIKTATISDKSIAPKSLSEISNQTEIQEAASKSNIKSSLLSSQKKFVVVGIQDGYGEPKSWISNENANKILGYDEAEKFFFNNFFINEWYKKDALKNFDNIDIFEDLTPEKWINWLTYFDDNVISWRNGIYNTDAKNPYDDFCKTFLNLPEDYNDKNGYKEGASILWKIFKNQYPVFNYKYTLNNGFNDERINTSRTQEFGDYSTQGLIGKETTIYNNDGTKTSSFKEGYQKPGVLETISLNDQKAKLDQLGILLEMMTYILSFISLFISTIIILLTTILIINENSQFIATMKVLGYTNRYVVGQVLWLYLAPLTFTIFTGFAIAWFSIYSVINAISSNSFIVIPFNFYYLWPILVIVIVMSIYLFTVLFGYRQISRVNPTLVLQINN
ncbi:ABC transporter permease [Spiroplasma apis]|uniref:ABC transporter permease n=1 Tax=Spiroplasma apis B31 TaxID=1276258 RepID=V5RHP9_SPIAP|nr:FtsX-like permease family protein [Spiroplasma apis]AHB36207.1 ABC transporter permease [Spiroplasma apis B31]